MKRIHRRLLIFCVLFFSGLSQIAPGFSQEAKPVEPELRGIWVTRWDYSSPGDIARIFASAREVSRIKERILRRLRRDEGVRALLEMDK